MRTIQVHPLSIACGVLVTAAVVLLSAQTTPPAQTTWPPPKSMVLNLFEEHSPLIQVPSGGTHTVLTVPADRWLTITGASVSNNTFAYNSLLRWVEVTSTGALVKKGVTVSGWPYNDYSSGTPYGAPEATPIGCGGPLGWVIAPGSSLGVFNPNSGAQPVGIVSLIGYYSRN